MHLVLTLRMGLVSDFLCYEDVLLLPLAILADFLWVDQYEPADEVCSFRSIIPMFTIMAPQAVCNVNDRYLTAG